MVTFEELSTVLDHTLQTTPNKPSSPVSYKDGTHGILSPDTPLSFISLVYRCTAKQVNLDGGGGQRSREHTELLVSEFELGVLWDEYGLVGDIVVRHNFISVSSLLTCGIPQPFTNDFPRADIHKLISPDLLHQLIKGTFKDHLVTWVDKYLVTTHGQARSKQILDDIDKR
jgi:hypothetical protein